MACADLAPGASVYAGSELAQGVHTALPDYRGPAAGNCLLAVPRSHLGFHARPACTAGVGVLASRVLYKWQQASSPRPALQLGWQVVQFCYKWLVINTLLLPPFQVRPPPPPSLPGHSHPSAAKLSP